MQIRIIPISAVCATAILAAALPAGALGGDTGRTVTTFLGLLSASILPSITLIVGSMSSSGRSVRAISELHDEMVETIGGLWSILKWVAFAVVGLAIAGINLPLELPDAILKLHPDYVQSVGRSVPRIGQFIVGLATSMAVWRFLNVPKSLRRSLDLRKHIAIDEARRKIGEKAPNANAVHNMFGTRAGFGEVKEVKVGSKG